MRVTRRLQVTYNRTWDCVAARPPKTCLYTKVILRLPFEATTGSTDMIKRTVPIMCCDTAKRSNKRTFKGLIPVYCWSSWSSHCVLHSRLYVTYFSNVTAECRLRPLGPISSSRCTRGSLERSSKRPDSRLVCLRRVHALQPLELPARQRKGGWTKYVRRTSTPISESVGDV